MTFQSTVLPVIPGIVSRPTAIPTVGNLLDIYPETFGGVCKQLVHHVVEAGAMYLSRGYNTCTLCFNNG